MRIRSWKTTPGDRARGLRPFRDDSFCLYVRGEKMFAGEDPVYQDSVEPPSNGSFNDHASAQFRIEVNSNQGRAADDDTGLNL